MKKPPSSVTCPCVACDTVRATAINQKGAFVRRVALFTCLVLVLPVLTGCDTLRQTWKDTQKLYRTYVDVDPKVDLEAEGHDPWEAKLGSLLSPVDMRIGELVRVVDARDSFPDDAWAENLIKRFPWLNGMAAVDMNGALLLARPEVTLKPLNLAPLLAAGDAWRDRRLRAFVESTPLGPEVYVASPFFKDNVLQGITAAHFDLRSVVQLSPDPQKLLVVSPEAVLWAGGFGEAAAAAQAEPWAEILKSDVQGEIKVAGRELVWITRYVGDRQIIYLTDLPPED